MECAVVAVSLVVPTYKRSRVVMRCLESIQQQTLADFELLLVDNSPDGELRPQVEAFNRTAEKKARYVPEPRLGLHNARHAGARAATGDVLVFTDDDAGFDPDWLAAYARCFEAHREMAAAGGPIRPAWEAPPPDWLTVFMRADPTMFPVLSLLELSRDFQLRHDGIFFGVNMAIRRDALFDAGGFNPEIFGDRWLGDGETGLNRKLWARGPSARQATARVTCTRGSTIGCHRFSVWRVWPWRSWARARGIGWPSRCSVAEPIRARCAC